MAPLRRSPARSGGCRSGRDLIVRQTGNACALLTAIKIETEDRFTPDDALVLGEMDGVTYLACDAPAAFELPEGWRAIDLWRLYGSIPEPDWMIAGYGAHILHWRRTSAHCPVCCHVCCR